jgi:hypothetical protein
VVLSVHFGEHCPLVAIRREVLVLLSCFPMLTCQSHRLSPPLPSPSCFFVGPNLPPPPSLHETLLSRIALPSLRQRGRVVRFSQQRFSPYWSFSIEFEPRKGSSLTSLQVIISKVRLQIWTTSTEAYRFNRLQDVALLRSTRHRRTSDSTQVLLAI